MPSRFVSPLLLKTPNANAYLTKAFSNPSIYPTGPVSRNLPPLLTSPPIVLQKNPLSSRHRPTTALLCPKQGGGTNPPLLPPNPHIPILSQSISLLQMMTIRALIPPYLVPHTPIDLVILVPRNYLLVKEGRGK